MTLVNGRRKNEIETHLSRNKSYELAIHENGASSTNLRIKRWKEKSLGLLFQRQTRSECGAHLEGGGKEGSTKKDKLQDDKDKEVKNKRKRKRKGRKGG